MALETLSTVSFSVPETVLEGISPTLREIVYRFLQHEREQIVLPQPTPRIAAVLVLIYEIAGQIRVLLTTRSKTMRAHPGQTALPGGKYEDADKSLVETAFREAHEEVGLPLRSHHIHPLCLLSPFISLHLMVVTPVVALLTDTSLLQNLICADGEVDRIFDHPLEAILEPELSRTLELSAKGEDWPYDAELHSTTDATWFTDVQYRMHRFRSTGSPIKGLTADILIMTAEIGYARSTAYERFAPGQLKAIATIPHILEAVEKGQDGKTKP